jgi:KRAB domain-containing zinc finger protein
MDKEQQEVDFWGLIPDENACKEPTNEASANFSFTNSFKLEQILDCIKIDIPESKRENQTSQNKKVPCKIQCSLCSFKTISKSHITRHMNKKHGIEQKIEDFKCYHCDYTTRQEAHLKRHNKSKHEGLRYPCPSCDMTFSIKDSVRIHRLAVHEQIDYPCPLCEFRGKRVDSLRYHIQWKHSNNSFSCEICQYTFKTKLHLKKHISVEHAGKRYFCQFKECEHTAKDKSSIARHVREEHHNLRYVCDFCKSDFSHITTAKIHISNQHPGSANNISIEQMEKGHKCNQCNFVTTSKIRLNRHISIDHKESLEIGTISCEICLFKTKSKAHLSFHKKVQHGINPPSQFECNQCDYISKNKHHLKRHQQLKHAKNGTKFPCNFCRKNFTLKCSLSKHIKRVHKNICESQSAAVNDKSTCVKIKQE